jgi:hypothetical protein
MRLMILFILILLVVAVPMMLLAVWLFYSDNMYVPAAAHISRTEALRRAHITSNRWKLELTEAETGRIIHKVFQGELLLGRQMEHAEPTGWLYFSKDPTVSRRQCRMTNTNQGLYIENLSSVNTTRVNGMPLRGYRSLYMGDYIPVGKHNYWVSKLRRVA